MESKRQQKFSRMIQKELGGIFQQNVKNIFGQAFITVTTVRMSPDLSLARVYLSVMMVKNKETFVAEINEKKNLIRKELGYKIGKIVRIVPDLQFFLDDSVDYAQKIDNILKGINTPDKT
jgi:ribosome-binding factor A